MGTKRAVLIGIRFLIAFAILYFVFSRIPLPEVISTLASTKLKHLIFASIVTIISQLIAAYRLKLLTSVQGISLTAVKVFEINLATAFYRLFLPGGNMAGGVIRLFKLTSHNKKSMEALASLAYDRIVATIALCIVGISFWYIHFPSDSAYLVLSMTFLLSGLIFINIILFYERTTTLATKIIAVLQLTFFSSVVERFSEIVKRFKSFSPGSIIYIFAISIISQLLGVLVYYLLARSLDVEISFLAMGWIRSVVVLITMIPISIAGLGLREGTLIILLRSYGIRDEDALALSFLIFSITVVVVGLIGGLLEARELFHPRYYKD